MVTYADLPHNSYMNTSAQKRVIGDVIHLLDPIWTPLTARLGLDSARSKFKLNLEGKKVEIIEDTYMPVSTTANQGTTITTTTLTLTVADASIFKIGHVIMIGSEKMVVASRPTTTTITVTARGFGSTTAATAAATATIYIVGMARLEGADVDYSSVTDFTFPYNYTAILEEAVKVTGTDEAISKYGLAGEYEYRKMKKVQELLRHLERMLFYGERVEGSASVQRSFGGLPTFITDNSSSITTTITKAALDGLSQKIYNDGGNPDLLVLPVAAAANLRSLLDSSSFLRVDQENTVFGMRPITRLTTQFHQDVEILVSTHCPATKAYMIDTAKAGLYTLRPFKEKGPFDHGGDYINGEIVGEFSFLMANDKAHGYVTTSAAAL